MRDLTRLLPALLLFGFLLLPSETHADPVVITSGSFFVTGGLNPSGPFSFQGEGFATSGFASGGRADAGAFCTPCLPGNSFNLIAVFTGGDIFFRNPTTFNGVSYDNLTSYVGGVFFNGGMVIIPPFDLSLPPGSTITLTAPFTFTGNLTGCTGVPASNCGPGPDAVFSTMLSGQGMATLQLSTFFDSGSNIRFYTFKSLSYDFQPAAPVPEPTTLLLLGTGLAGAVVRNARRRARSKE